MSTKPMSAAEKTRFYIVSKLRKEGKSIKAIARLLHISDKTVAAIVKVYDKKLKREAAFQRFIKQVCDDTEIADKNFIATLHKSLLSQLADALIHKRLIGRHEIKPALFKAFEDTKDAFAEAVSLHGILSFWTMPVYFKRLWAQSLYTEPENPYATKNKKGKKK